jgi:hypothetical protein
MQHRFKCLTNSARSSTNHIPRNATGSTSQRLITTSVTNLASVRRPHLAQLGVRMKQWFICQPYVSFWPTYTKTNGAKQDVIGKISKEMRNSKNEPNSYTVFSCYSATPVWEWTLSSTLYIPRNQRA